MFTQIFYSMIYSIKSLAIYLLFAPLLLAITIPASLVLGVKMRLRRGIVTDSVRKAFSFFFFMSLSLGFGGMYELVHFTNTPFLFGDAYCNAKTGVDEHPIQYKEFPIVSVVCLTNDGSSIETVAPWVNPVLLLALFHSGVALSLSLFSLFRKGEAKRKSPSPLGEGLIRG